MRPLGLWTAALAALTLPGWLAAQPSLEPRLSTFWDDWKSEVGLLMSPEETARFDSLADDAARDAFATAFWKSRGQEAVERWARNNRAVDQLRPRSTWARQALLLFGKPASIEHVEPCGGLRPMQVWRWDPWHVERQGGHAEVPATLILVQESRLLPTSFRPWSPDELADLGYTGSPATDLDDYLERARAGRCIDPGIHRALTTALSFGRLRETMPWPEPSPDWLRAVSDDRERQPADRPATFEIRYTGNNGRQTILHGVLRIRREALQEIVPGQVFDRITLVGDVYRRDYLVDSFEVVHHVAGSPPGDVIGLDLFRGLRPGAHRLELRVLDRNGQTLLHLTRDLEVPRLETPPPPLAGRRRDYGQLTREEVVLLDTFPSVEILPLAAPAGGRTDLVAITTGGPIAAVAFYVDDQLAGVDETAPFGARLVLSEGSHRIRAVARDTQAHPLAEDEREVDLARRPFRVRLSRPEGASRALRARVTLPEGSQLARLECFDGREPVATLTEAPFECPLPARAVGGLRYVRATATLVDGETAEDLLFFGPRTPENVDVQLVQLLVSVFDGSGRPVGGLGAADFRIWEEGRQLDLVRLESLADLPISVAVLMDLSSSMGRLAGLAAESAQRFFERVLTETDLASLLAFNDGFHQLVPFTGDIDELRLGAEGVRALGSTRLHDGIVWALGQYAGQRNRRALVILSDGADVGSDYPLEQVVQAAVDAGVAIYPVSLVRPGERSPESLDPLAARTGGTRYVVGSIEELDRAFRLIAHELRSQYLLVYSVAEGEEDGTAPGAVDIEVLRSGLTTRNVRSYPP